MSSPRTESPHSAPIPITAQSRHRAMSYSSSNGSPDSPTTIQTPISPLAPISPKIATSPSASPILSYFMSGSPVKGNTFPFRRPSDAFSGAPPVFEEEPEQDNALRTHSRRATTAGLPGNGRFAQVAPTPFTQPLPEHAQRGAGIMRRLSLGAGFNKPVAPQGPAVAPDTPPPSAFDVSPPSGGLPAAKPTARTARRATMLGALEGRPHRAPSPMGERILKGHFDGFN